MMENDLSFRVLLLVLIVAFVAHRGYYTKKRALSEESTVKKREEGLASRLAGIMNILAFGALIAYIFTPAWMAWASVPLPPWPRWTGLAIALAGFALLQWAQNALGKNWSDTPRIMKEQKLITSGPYHWIRHPIYTSFILILGSTLLISANWLIGVTWIGATVLEIVSRIGFEESVLLEYFGNEYREYMKRTGSLLPKFI